MFCVFHLNGAVHPFHHTADKGQPKAAGLMSGGTSVPYGFKLFGRYADAVICDRKDYCPLFSTGYPQGKFGISTGGNSPCRVFQQIDERAGKQKPVCRDQSVRKLVIYFEIRGVIIDRALRQDNADQCLRGDGLMAFTTIDTIATTKPVVAVAP